MRFENLELTNEEVKEILETLKEGLSNDDWLENASEGDIAELKKAIELCKVGMSDLEKELVLKCLDDNCLFAFGECFDSVEEVAGYIGKVLASIWYKLYVEEDEDEDDE